MSKYIVTFIGDTSKADTDPPSITFRGVVFPLNEGVPLAVESDTGRDMLKRLQGNGHFTVVEAGAAVEVEPVTDEAEPVAKPKRGRAPKVDKAVTDDNDSA